MTDFGFEAEEPSDQQLDLPAALPVLRVLPDQLHPAAQRALLVPPARQVRPVRQPLAVLAAPPDQQALAVPARRADAAHLGRA